MSVPFLVVQIDGRRCALPARQIETVLAAVAVTPTGASSNPQLLGAVNVRGTALPAFDLRRPQRVGIDDRMVLVALDSGHKRLLLCDGVEGLVNRDEAAGTDGRAMLPPALESPSGGYLVEDDGLTLIFDLTTLLADGGDQWWGGAP